MAFAAGIGTISQMKAAHLQSLQFLGYTILTPLTVTPNDTTYDRPLILDDTNSPLRRNNLGIQLAPPVPPPVPPPDPPIAQQ
jgi:hypothetical protein